MKSNFKKISLIIVFTLIILFVLNGSVLALTLIEPENGIIKRGDEISFTTLKTNDFSIVGVSYEDSSTHAFFESAGDYVIDYGDESDTTKKITLKSELTENLLALKNYTIKTFKTEEDLMIGTNYTGISKEFRLEPKRDNYVTSYEPQNPKKGDIIIFKLNVPKAETLRFLIDNINLTEGEDKDYICKEVDTEGGKAIEIRLTGPYVTNRLSEGAHVASIVILDGTKDIKFTVEKDDNQDIPDPDPSEYKVVEHWNSVFVVGRPVVLKTNIPVHRFESIAIDDEPIINKVYNEKYTVENRDNVAILVLKEELTATLEPNVEHVLRINANNGGFIDYSFTLKKKDVMSKKQENIKPGDTLEFISEANIDDFVAAYINGNLLTKGEHYNLSEGSIVIKFLKALLDLLQPGETYTLDIESTNGVASAEFTMPKAVKSNNPDTGDHLVIFASFALIILTFVLVIVIKKHNKKQKI